MNPTGRPPAVLIVGAGPVGLVAAAELLRHGASVRIIEEDSGIMPGSRSVSIQARTLEVFADMGLVYRVLDVAHRIHGASIYAGSRRILHFAFDELRSPFPFAVDLAQPETERLLTEHLASLGGAVEYSTVLLGFDQHETGVSARLGHAGGLVENAAFDYLVGCDGSQSTVRSILGLPFEGETLAPAFLLADAKLEWDLPDDEWTLWFAPSGMVSVLPLPGGLHRIMADLPDNHAPNPGFDEMLRIWNERAGGRAAPHDPVWVTPFKVNSRKVPRYQQGRVFLAGDAAHSQSPAGGQGMNTGIQDAYNLAWKLALAGRGKSPVSLLDSYTAEREPVARGVLELTRQITSMSILRQPVEQQLRNRILPLLAQFEVIEQRFVNRLSETSINYRSSPIVSQSGRWWATTPAPGDRAPAGDHVLRTPRFKVLMFTGAEPDEDVMDHFTTIARYMATGYYDEVDVWLVSRGPLAWNGNRIEDETGEWHQSFGAGLPCVYVIRPDNYIGFRSLGAEPLPVLEYLGTLFDSEPKVAAP